MLAAGAAGEIGIWADAGIDRLSVLPIADRSGLGRNGSPSSPLGRLNSRPISQGPDCSGPYPIARIPSPVAHRRDSGADQGQGSYGPRGLGRNFAGISPTRLCNGSGRSYLRWPYFAKLRPAIAASAGSLAIGVNSISVAIAAIAANSISVISAASDKTFGPPGDWCGFGV